MDSEVTRQVLAGAFADAMEEAGFAPPGYEIHRELDRGGMAVVYEATQLQPEREVALKVVLPKFAGEEEIRVRFQREGRAMAALEHPGVLPIYEVGEWDGLAFLTMKLAGGGTLQGRLLERAPSVSEAVDWLIAAGEAVHFAHQRGVLHRDLKPGNLLFDEEGKIFVGDFGVAKLEFASDGGLTRTEALVGTPHYLAPEVASGESSSGSVAADLYGLGAVFYECLTGKRPHDGAENLAAQLRQVADEEVVMVRKLRPEVPRDVAVICEKALARNPGERYASVARFVEDLRRWRERRVILARPASVPERIWRWGKRHPLPAGLLAALVAMAVLGGVVLFENYQRRGELLYESLVEQARAERLLREPGFRKRALVFLEEAKGIRARPRIREEAVAVLTHWDVGEARGGLEAAEAQGDILVVDGGLQVGEDLALAGGVLRCPPARSGDGRFLALVYGERMEVKIYDRTRKKEFAVAALEGWPERVRFGERGATLQVIYEGGVADWLRVDGEVLLDGVPAENGLLEPVGFGFWEGHYLSPVEANVYGGVLSPSEGFLATASAVGVQIWGVSERRSLGFYEVENQRVDAPTDAWWLSDSELLIQVPGALELLRVGEGGEILSVEPLSRVPGTKVQEVLSNGDWVVEVMDEDGGTLVERWRGGDFEEAEDWSDGRVVEEVHSGGQVEYGEWVLTLPGGCEVLQVFELKDAGRVVVLAKDYRVCDWDLRELEAHLESLGL